MTEKTGLEKMVDVLKGQIIKTSHGDLTEFGEGCIFFLKDMLDNAEMFLKQEQEARRLLADEAKEKATDTDTLVDEIARLRNFAEWFAPYVARLYDIECIDRESELFEVLAKFNRIGVDKIISRYRPSPKPSESELVNKIEKYLSHSALPWWPSETVKKEILEILSKHTKDSK